MPRRSALVIAAVGVLGLVALAVAGAGLGRSGALAEPATSASSPSWNRNVPCAAAVTTLATILGRQRSAGGGATFAGGGFKPGVPDRRDITPPCAVAGKPTLVELHRVVIGSCSKINKDGDWTCGLTDPSRPAGNLNRIHIETDMKLRAKGGWTFPPGGTPIDVQGFVFWDPDHVEADFHNHSGWELHSFTAWRRSR